MNARGDDAIDVLVCLPNWLGDVVMASPMLGLLAAARHEDGRPLRVAASVRRRWRPLLADDPRLAAIHTYERSGTHRGPIGLLRLARAWRALRARSVILAPPSFRAALVARLAGIPQRIGVSAEGRAWLLSNALTPVRPRGERHHIEELCDLGAAALADLGATPGDGFDRDPRLPAMRTVAPTEIGPGPALWILAPGATYGSAKAWPPARVASFLHLAVADRGVRVALVSDAAGAGLVAAIREAAAGLDWRTDLAGPAGVVDLSGRTSLLDLVALLRAARAFVGNDSGVMHLAATLGLPTLGLFGSSSLAWTAPRGPRARALAATGFPCQPCFRRTCNQPTFCLDTITAESAMQSLEELLPTDREGACS